MNGCWSHADQLEHHPHKQTQGHPVIRGSVAGFHSSVSGSGVGAAAERSRTVIYFHKRNGIPPTSASSPLRQIHT